LKYGHSFKGENVHREGWLLLYRPTIACTPTEEIRMGFFFVLLYIAGHRKLLYSHYPTPKKPFQRHHPPNSPSEIQPLLSILSPFWTLSGDISLPLLHAAMAEHYKNDVWFG
jgi:hypothetical protein